MDRWAACGTGKVFPKRRYAFFMLPLPVTGGNGDGVPYRFWLERKFFSVGGYLGLVAELCYFGHSDMSECPFAATSQIHSAKGQDRRKLPRYRPYCQSAGSIRQEG